MNKVFMVFLLCSTAACARLDKVGKLPELSPADGQPEHVAMMTPAPSKSPETYGRQIDQASLWSRDRHSLLGDRRALQKGDILTVVIEIDDRAEISNSSDRSRSGSENVSIPSFFGIPQRINQALPAGASLDQAASANSTSSSSGAGSVSRREKLTLRIAATVVDVLQNGVLSVQGSQEVRVNFEVRELLVSGYVRPEDISRQNEITYDKIASARVSYGGRGHISDVQQPRIGQQIADAILPF